MRHNAAGDAPEPLDVISIRVIDRHVDEMQLIGEFGQHAMHEQGALRCMGLEIVCNDNRRATTLLRPRHRSTHLLTKDISEATRAGATDENATALITLRKDLT